MISFLTLDIDFVTIRRFHNDLAEIGSGCRLDIGFVGMRWFQSGLIKTNSDCRLDKVRT